MIQDAAKKNHRAAEAETLQTLLPNLALKIGREKRPRPSFAFVLQENTSVH